MTDRTTPTTYSTPPMHHTRLIEILDRKRDIVVRLADLARQQGAIVPAGRTDALLDLLGRRQSLIDEMLEFQDEFVSLMRGLGPLMEGVPSDQRDRIRALVAEIGAGLEEVTKHDDRDREALQHGRNAAHGELHRLGGARRAHAAYAGAAADTNRFADSRG